MINSIAEKKPELVSEWSDKNFPLIADDITYGSNKLYWWKGTCGHEWQASAKSRSSGEKCPICSGARVVEGINDIASLFTDIAAEWSEKNNPLKPTMVSVGSHKKVIWRCSKGHEWRATVKSRTINNTGCPYCSHNIILPGYNDLKTSFPEVAAEWSERNLPLRSDMVTAYANKKVWWRCEKGHEWSTLISTRSYGSKCPYCSGIKLLKGFNDFETLHPELAQEWSERNITLLPSMVNDKSLKKVWWGCKTCGYEWQTSVISRIKGSKCPVCSEKEVHIGYNALSTTDPLIAAEWDYDKNKELSPEKLTRNSLYNVWWKCPHGHSWKARISDRTTGCAECSECKKEYDSVFPELLITLYAKRNDCSVVLHSDKYVGLPIDVMIPSLRLGIDCTNPSNAELRAEREIKRYICQKNEISFYDLLYQGDEVGYADEIKKVFRKLRILISSDTQADIEVIRTRFEQWRNSIEI